MCHSCLPDARPLGQHTQLPLPRQLLAAAGKTPHRDVAAGTRNVWITAAARDPRGRQGGQWGMLNRHTHSALPDQPKPSEGPTVQPGPFRERCRGDGDCPDAQKCCNSSCGHQCLPGVPAGEAGWGRMGQDGQSGRGRVSETGNDAVGQQPPRHRAVAQTGLPTPCLPGWLCRPWGGDKLHSSQVGTGVGREGDSETTLW